MANHLATETSPYLQQHAGNPVDWYPWGEHALTLARAGARPILLSIGYSACHWCHVMAHESFEDPATAAVMNELFVNIKVDREERPDLDQIYQTAHQMLTGRPGGWPLTMFLTSDGTPFFGGTYFPNVPRHGLPAFAELCRDVAETHRRRPNDIAEQNRELRRLLAATVPRPTKLSLGGTGLQVRDALLQHYDPRYGGFGGAPKFPQASDLAFLLCAAGAGDAAARDAVLTTLRRMAQGGLYDQLGGGFFRYSVDERWEIPHFEKMLYDNGQLLGLYADAWQVSGDSLFSRVVMETADWAMRDMQLPGGGFASSLDADTEGEEGGYYVWQESEIRSQLADAEWRLASRSWGLDRPANFEDSAWHLQLVAEPDPADLPLLDSARAKLRAARGQRVPPGRDDKVLTAWNALMIDGLARAGMIFGKVEWLAAARRAFEFVQTTLWQNGRLLATARDGRAHLPAYLDDYAFLLLATESLIAAEFRPADLVFARTLADALLAHFEDKTDGGFFFTAHDHEALIHRPKPVFDNPLPGSNAAAARALLRLGGRMGEPRYLDAATCCLQLFQQHIERSAGFGVATLAMALDELQETPSAAPVCTAAGCVLPS